jgi:hypothetical protein
MESLTESNVCNIEDASDERSEESSDSSFENANEQADHDIMMTWSWKQCRQRNQHQWFKMLYSQVNQDLLLEIPGFVSP